MNRKDDFGLALDLWPDLLDHYNASLNFTENISLPYSQSTSFRFYSDPDDPDIIAKNTSPFYVFTLTPLT